MSIETSRLAVNDQTAEIITRIPVTTWVDGSPITDARCGGLYNKDSLGYFKLGVAGEFPISRLKNPTLANIQKLIADVGVDGNVTIVIDKIVDVTANGSSLGVNCNIRIQSGGGFNVPNATHRFAIGAPVTLPPNQVFYGEGIVRLPYTPNFDPRWWGAKASSQTTTYMSGVAFNLCAKCAQDSSSSMIIPPGIYDLEETFDPPANLKITGSGWRNCSLRGATQGIPLVDLTASNILTDVFIRGNNLSTRGINIEGVVNRVQLRNVRVERCTEYGFYCTSLQNSLIEEVFIQDCEVANFYLGGAGPENCTFLNVNGNHNSSVPDPNAAYSVYINYSRSCRFIGGIFERGNLAYPVYIVDSSQLYFFGGEIQSSGKACVYLEKGTTTFLTAALGMPTIAAGGYVIETGVAGQVRLINCTVTGAEGRGQLTRYKGNVYVDYNSDLRILNENYRFSHLGDWQGIGGGSVTKIQEGNFGDFGGLQRVSTLRVSQGAIRASTPADIIKAGQTLRVRFTVKNIGGNGQVLLYRGTETGVEYLVGRFTEGTWDIPVVDTNDTRNTWIFRNNENVAKSWDIYEFFVDVVNGVPQTLAQFGITDAYTKTEVDSKILNYTTLTSPTIDLSIPNKSGEHTITQNTNYSFTNITNGVKQDYSIYNSTSGDVTIGFTGAKVGVGSLLTIPPANYVHVSISVHWGIPEVIVTLLTS